MFKKMFNIVFMCRPVWSTKSTATSSTTQRLEDAETTTDQGPTIVDPDSFYITHCVCYLTSDSLIISWTYHLSWVSGLRCGSMSAKQMGDYSGGCTCTGGPIRGLESAAATSSSILQWSVSTIQSVWRGEKPLSLPLQQWVMKFQQPLFATTLSDLPSLYFDVLGGS